MQLSNKTAIGPRTVCMRSRTAAPAPAAAPGRARRPVGVGVAARAQQRGNDVEPLSAPRAAAAAAMFAAALVLTLGGAPGAARADGGPETPEEKAALVAEQRAQVRSPAYLASRRHVMLDCNHDTHTHTH